MQMSYEGLVRALLYQILDQAPDLVPVAQPHKVEAAILLGEHIHQRVGANAWTWEEFLRAFRLLIKRDTKNHRIAYFIDGMDDFQSKPSDLVNNLCNKSSGVSFFWVQLVTQSLLKNHSKVKNSLSCNGDSKAYQKI